jgi:hypothetical protein
MIKMVKENPIKVPKYICESCEYKTSNKKDYNKHLLTQKHINGNDDNQNETKNEENICKIYKCKCGKEYKHSSGLSRHKKECVDGTNGTNIESETKDVSNNYMNELMKQSEIMMLLIKENKEFKEIIMEQNKKIMTTNNITNNNNNNCHNKTKFNMNIFLNEKCKDALNIMDFANSLELQLNDLENVGRLGYVEGISKILINGLKKLDVFKRPIHCSDLKREILYVKDENTWEKDNEENTKIKKVIKTISHNNIKQIPEWQKENPQSEDITTKKHDQYMKIVGESMGGFTTEENEKLYDKIVKNVSKEVMIDKE